MVRDTLKQKIGLISYAIFGALRVSSTPVLVCSITLRLVFNVTLPTDIYVKLVGLKHVRPVPN